jgi:hypothetical protein
MAEDDDTRKDPARHPRQEAIDALYSALAGVQTECNQLDIAIQNQDGEDADIAAHDAVSCWLAAKAALQRIPETVDRKDAALAAWALAAAHGAIAEQLDRVAAHIASPALRRLLLRLKLGLAIAHGGPPRSDTRGP